MAQTNEQSIEVLTFMRGDETATVATNGALHAVYTRTYTRKYTTLHAAIAHLESRGYSIRTDIHCKITPNEY